MRDRFNTFLYKQMLYCMKDIALLGKLKESKKLELGKQYEKSFINIILSLRIRLLLIKFSIIDAHWI